ncbi:MAG: TIM barrel protein [Patescibacteria group bacterium]
MIIGFKTGPRNWDVAQKIVEEDGATMCEAWFNVGKESEYQEMFAWLQEHSVKIGLHHWGLAQKEFKTNLSTNNSAVRKESLAQMKHTIDIGKEIGAAYVNVHPGARWLERINFSTDDQERVEGSETPPDAARDLLLAGAAELNSYAEERAVLFTVETLPGREAYNSLRREGIYDSGNPPLAWIEEIGSRGGYVANDITHSASVVALADSSPAGMWQGLLDFTRRVAPHTKLVHVNTMIPPFDGRDSHNGLLPADFSQGSVPTREQIVQLLSLFAQRDDVYVVPEPQIQFTRENFLALKEIAEEAKVA